MDTGYELVVDPNTYEINTSTPLEDNPYSNMRKPEKFGRTFRGSQTNLQSNRGKNITGNK